MSLPLEGIRVVDFSRVLAGPHCAKTLLDLGADVVKIEPPSGDLSRKAFPGKGEISGCYAQQNAGKRNLSIDLNVEGARDVVAKLCNHADVIVENFRPGALAAFGLDYDTVSVRTGAWCTPRSADTGSTDHGVPGWRTPQPCKPRRVSPRTPLRRGSRSRRAHPRSRSV
jgi:hypothetical protein